MPFDRILPSLLPLALPGSSPPPSTCSQLRVFIFPSFFTQLSWHSLCCPCTHGCGAINWSMANLLGAIILQKTDFCQGLLIVNSSLARGRDTGVPPSTPYRPCWMLKASSCAGSLSSMLDVDGLALCRFPVLCAGC